MADEDYIAAAAELAAQSVREGWGGPFGAVIVRDGGVVATGQNLVLRTGDPTAHAEVVAIRNAAAALWPDTLRAAPQDPTGRAAMLSGCWVYASSFPCPMCLSAISWARLDGLIYGCDVADAADIGFDDAFQYADLARPVDQRSFPIRQAGRDIALPAMRAWLDNPQRQLY